MTEVALLGVKGGPSIMPGSPMPTSHLLRMCGQNIVIDCGLGVSAAVVGQGLKLRNIDAIVITHLHSDHYLELGPLLHTSWCGGLSRVVPIYGPERLKIYLEGFFVSMLDDIDLRIEDEGRPDLRKLIDFRPLSVGSFDLGEGLIMKTMHNVHPPIDDSFSLRFEAVGECVVFSGDTAAMPEMVEFAKDADLLIHEAMHLDGVDALCARVANGDDRLKTHLLRSHTPAHDAARIATEASVRILAFNHLVPAEDPNITETEWRAEVEKEFSGDFRLGRDGMVIEI